MRRSALNAARVSASVVEVVMQISLCAFQLIATDPNRITSEEIERRSDKSVAKLESTNTFKQWDMSIFFLWTKAETGEAVVSGYFG